MYLDNIHIGLNNQKFLFHKADGHNTQPLCLLFIQA